MPETLEAKAASKIEDSTYSGYFNFQNNLQRTIQSGWAAHWTDDSKESIDLAGLNSTQTTVTVPFNTSSSDKDHWGFSATTTDGYTYSYGDKDCGFESEDAGTVMLSAFDTYLLFTVAMPVSSGCEGTISLQGPTASDDKKSNETSRQTASAHVINVALLSPAHRAFPTDERESKNN